MRRRRNCRGRQRLTETKITSWVPSPDEVGPNYSSLSLPVCAHREWKEKRDNRVIVYHVDGDDGDTNAKLA